MKTARQKLLDKKRSLYANEKAQFNRFFHILNNSVIAVPTEDNIEHNLSAIGHTKDGVFVCLRHRSRVKGQPLIGNAVYFQFMYVPKDKRGLGLARKTMDVIKDVASRCKVILAGYPQNFELETDAPGFRFSSKLGDYMIETYSDDLKEKWKQGLERMGWERGKGENSKSMYFVPASLKEVKK